MNKSEFLKALAALPPEYEPTYEGVALRYERKIKSDVRSSQTFCPLTAVANVQKPVAADYYGTLNVSYGADQLKMDRSLAWAVAAAADDPRWYDGLFRRRIRRIFRKQFTKAYPNSAKVPA